MCEDVTQPRAVGWLPAQPHPILKLAWHFQVPTAFVASKDPLCTKAAISLSSWTKLNIYPLKSATDRYRNQS